MKAKHFKLLTTVRLFVIATLLAASLTALAPPSVAHAATFTVNTTADTDDANKGNGVCADSSGHCSLRAAISEANALAGADTITLPAGTYTLSIAGAGEDNNATGDLDVWSTITVNGAGADSTIIQAGTDAGNGIDRVFDVWYSNLTLNSVTVRHGKTSAGGGGVNSYQGTVTLNHSTLSSNSATGDGGGVRNYEGTLTLNHSTLSGNSAGGAGGGVCNYGGATIDHSTLSGNSAGSCGGISSAGQTLALTNSTLSDNSASGGGGGGGVCSYRGTATLTNCTLYHNYAGLGGGVYSQVNASATLNLVHCTLTDNMAAGYPGGGGIFREGGTVNLKNTIVFGNTASPYPECYGSLTSQGYNVVRLNGSCPSDGTGDQTTTDAGLSNTLADNGGPTRTNALFSGSPARNAIPFGANGCGSDYTADQRGIPRPIGGACDVGAYEAGAAIWTNRLYSEKWSEAHNWLEETVPGADNLVVFSTLSDANANMDASFTIAGVIIDGAYDGVISQGSYGLTVNGDWEQSGGAFAGGSGTLDLNGAFDLSSGTFTAPSGLMAVSGGFHHTGGAFDPNGGRVVLDNTADQTLATTFNDLVINDGLVGYWKLDEGSGVTANDSSGYGYHGTLQGGGAAWSTDVPPTLFANSNSLSFDGTGSYVEMDDTYRINSLQHFTMATWVKMNTMGTNDYRFLYLRGDKASLRYDHRGYGRLEFFVQIVGSNRVLPADNVLSAGSWLHVAGSYDGATMRAYVNGTEVGSLPITGTVAAYNGVLLTGPDQPLNGLLDDVRIYDRALSATEISDLAAGKHPQTTVATTTLGAALDVNGDLTLNSGTLDVSASNYGINLAGDFTRNGGVFTARSGTVTFDGSGTQTLDTDAITFYNLTVNSGSTLLDAAEFTVDGTLTNNGALQKTQDVNGSSAVNFFQTGGYGGLSLNAMGSDLGSTTVTIKGNQECTTGGGTVKRCFDITPTNTSGRNATITFFYDSSEGSGNNCNTLNVYHWTRSAWEVLTLDTAWGDDGRVCEAVPLSVRVKNVTSFSPFVLKSGSPTAVELVSFTAMPAGDGAAIGLLLAALLALGGVLAWRKRGRKPDGIEVRLGRDRQADSGQGHRPDRV